VPVGLAFGAFASVAIGLFDAFRASSAFRPTVNFLLQPLHTLSLRLPMVLVSRTPLLMLCVEPQNGHFGFLPRFMFS
jgi:hypothetical protein